MTESEFSQRLGRVVSTTLAGETVNAFVPPPLPPVPEIDVLSILKPLGEAERALGRLDGISALLPRQELFLYMYVRKEAVLSSQIEGTQSTLSDLLKYETEAKAGNPVDDIREVSNYVDAMMFGLERMESLPLSLRLIREMHGLLLQGGRGGSMSPGQFRRSQNWIGGTRPGNALYVPPPITEMNACLNAMEAFFHETSSGMPPLLKAGLLHVQFESIHPFLDGNGRMGRLLITLFLCSNRVLKRPLLYLSLYLKSHRTDYYRLLQEVREHGAWEAWLEFFLNGVAETANQAFEAATQIIDLFRADRERIAEQGARVSSALRIFEHFQMSPFLTSGQLVGKSALTAPTVNSALADLERLGILQEITGRKRGRVYCYRKYLDLLGEGTDPLPR